MDRIIADGWKPKYSEWNRTPW